MATNHHIIGKILVKAEVKNTSPLLIASGKGDELDFEVIKDRNDKPFIPAAGFVGMLRAGFDGVNKDEMQFRYLFGSEGNDKKDLTQSHLIIDDLTLKGDYNVMVRDGVAIEAKTNLAKRTGKYDYELLEPDSIFCLNMEITLRTGFDKDIFLQFLHFIKHKGKNGGYQQGAFKTNGFGLLEWASFEVYIFDFQNDSDKTNANAWFNYVQDSEKATAYKTLQHTFEGEPALKENRNVLKITGNFALNTSLIIGSDEIGLDADEKNAAKKNHLKNSAGTPLLTAKSLRGPIRHRALRILNTIWDIDTSNHDETKPKTEAETFIDELFGFVQEETQNRKKGANKGKFKTFEALLEKEKVDATQIQPRVKIDRFTGGAMDTALTSSQPLWDKGNTFCLRFEIENCTEREAGLFLLVMKDLITSDLAIGGEKAIGRGTLKGESLTVEGKVNEETEIRKGNEKVKTELKEVFNDTIKFNRSGIDEDYKSHIKTVNDWVTAIRQPIKIKTIPSNEPS